MTFSNVCEKEAYSWRNAWGCYRPPGRKPICPPYLKAGLILWGEGASLDIGARMEIFEAERKVLIDTPYIGPRLAARQHMVKTSVLPVVGWTVYPLEGLSMGASLTVPTGKDEPMTALFTMGMMHWFLKK